MARSGTSSVLGQSSAPSSAETKARLINGAIEALREVGFSGASAREIARRADSNQGLVFYHFGSVANLLLAALDKVSATRLAQYHAAIEAVTGFSKLMATAQSIFEEDLDAGHIAVLAEMISGSATTAGLGSEVAERIAPWRDFAASAVRRALANSPVFDLVNPEELAHGIVALYLGLEMLAHLDGDRTPALALFDRARQISTLLDALGGSPNKESRQ